MFERSCATDTKMEIRGKAPLRISFAGGGTDINEVFEKYGGAVINTTINKYIHMSLIERKDKEILVNGLRMHDEFTSKIIEKINPKQGFEIYYYNDIPPGRGLGSSSTYSILLTKMIYEYLGIKIKDQDLVDKSYGVESEVGKCGWQDQYAVAVGGINFMEFQKEGTRVYPLRLKREFIKELESYLVMVYTKKEHNAKKLEEKNIKLVTKEKANQLKKYAEDIRDCLFNGEIHKIGKIFHDSWMVKRNSITSNKELDKMYKMGRYLGAEGGKLLGAGAGGYFLFFIDPKNRNNLINYFKDYEVFIPELSEKGVETWCL